MFLTVRCDVRRQLLSGSAVGDLGLRTRNVLPWHPFRIRESGDECLVDFIHKMGLDSVDGKYQNTYMP